MNTGVALDFRKPIGAQSGNSLYMHIYTLGLFWFLKMLLVSSCLLQVPCMAPRVQYPCAVGDGEREGCDHITLHSQLSADIEREILNSTL